MVGMWKDKEKCYQWTNKSYNDNVSEDITRRRLGNTVNVVYRLEEIT